ncbi:MAG: bacteriocin [Streptococcaceae bacterium]|jgi:bacteriocin-like protein|nr:bacteriocin [Streptococcaceae bacterium]
MENRLLKLLKKDKTAMKKFINIKSKEEALAVAKGYISDYTETELLDDIQNFQASQAGEKTLSDEELTKVVGGVAQVINLDHVIEGLINFDS